MATFLIGPFNWPFLLVVYQSYSAFCVQSKDLFVFDKLFLITTKILLFRYIKQNMTENIFYLYEILN